MDKILQTIYTEHHRTGKRYGYSFEGRLRADVILKWIGRGKRVLDAGCRDGVFTEFLMDGNHVFGIDIDQNALALCRQRLHLPVARANLNAFFPFQEATFDVVILGEILEHTLSPKAVLNECARILRPGGLMAGSVPNAYRLKNRLLFLAGKSFDPDPTHLHQFSPRRLHQVLEEHFSVVEIKMMFGRFTAISGPLFGNTIIFLCRKK